MSSSSESAPVAVVERASVLVGVAVLDALAVPLAESASVAVVDGGDDDD